MKEECILSRSAFVLTRETPMPLEPIVKAPRDLKVTPNLPDYDQSRATFSWDQARRNLDGLPDG
jgi:hypothetical protein